MTLRRLKVRITAISTLVVLAVLTLTGVALLVAQRHVLTVSVDETLARQSATVVALLAARPIPDPLPGQGDDDAFAQIVDGEGSVVSGTANLDGRPALDLATGGRPTYLTRRISGMDSASRVRSERVGGYVVHVGTPLDDVEDSIAALRRGLLVAVPVVSACLAGLLWFLIGRVLRTVEESTRRHQRFIADASHELRSPLARMRVALEVDLAHPDGADPADTLRSVLEESVGMQRLVDDLLLLARGEHDGAAQRRESVDLDDLVLREAERLRANGRVSVDMSKVSAARVLGDSAQLARVLRNLTDNAERHAASIVTLTLAEVGDTVEVAVADDGPGIPTAEREKVFERFTRLDAARSSSAGGSGLGLAIAREIVKRHGGSIWIDPEHAVGARVVVRLSRHQE